MEKQIVWIDKNRHEYSIDEIDNQYLMNIVKFLLKGGGYIYDTPNMDKSIETIYDECYKRGLMPLNKVNAYKEEVLISANRTLGEIMRRRGYFINKWFKEFEMNDMFGDVAPNDKEEE